MIDGKLVLGYMPDGTGATCPFNKLYPVGKDVSRSGFDNVDALVLWGGEDISSSYYKQKPHNMTQNSSGIPSSRDKAEWKAMLYAKANNLPIIGVCRGAQFLCCFSGGKLIQHVNRHSRSHEVNCGNEFIATTSSCHHQMMYPFDVRHELLAWSNGKLSTVYEDGENMDVLAMQYHQEPEVVYFPQTNGLAIQGHPEWMEEDDLFVMWLLEIIEQKFIAAEVAA